MRYQDVLRRIDAHALAERGRRMSPSERTAWSESGNWLEHERGELIVKSARAVNLRVKRTPPHRYSIPYQFPAAATAILPFAWIVSMFVRSRRRSMRLKRGLCVRCGYDLRASGERCPECGAARAGVAT